MATGNRFLKVRWLKPSLLDPGIRDAVDRLHIVDAHEHVEDEPRRMENGTGIRRILSGYVMDDLFSTGLLEGQDPWNQAIDDVSRWAMIEPAWKATRHTGYAVATRLSADILYGIRDLNERTVPQLAKRMATANKAGVTERIIRERAGIECCLVDPGPEGTPFRETVHPGLFLSDINIGEFLPAGADMSRAEGHTGLKCGSFADWGKLIDKVVEQWGPRACALKNAAAYWRTCRYEDVADDPAGKVFERGVLKAATVPPADWKALQDWTFHRFIRRAIDLNLPVKIHAGHHAGTGYSDLANSRPADLTNLFKQYPKARFDIFHIGYPDYGDVLSLAKHYPNVAVNMCWAWSVDPVAALDFARRALVTLPANKVFGFGGDSFFADQIPGHARIARDGIALVLTEAFREGRLTISDAKSVARMWLRDNAMEYFRIQQKRALQRARKKEAGTT
jgi:predicted TIM-barrel fold metal-dependent hydrolase